MTASRQPTLGLPLSRDRFASLLLHWYQHHRRDLPWRENDDPYQVWVSEVMLQQTRVALARTYYQRFLERFPTVESLAAATQEEVLTLWSGLGYYTRARNLHRAAREICNRHQGRFPENLQEAVQLPGVGRYTAGAVLSIARGLPLPILDGNIRRFLCRLLKLEEPAGAFTDGRLWKLLESLVQSPEVVPRVRDLNQALMELGALVCKPARAECALCPFSHCCRAHLAGVEQDLPRRPAAREPVRKSFVVAVLKKGDRFLLGKNLQGDLLKGLWEFPRIEGSPGPGLRQRLENATGLSLRTGAWLSPIRHQITRYRITFYPLLCQLKKPARGPKWVWSRPGASGCPVSSYVTKIQRMALRSWPGTRADPL